MSPKLVDLKKAEPVEEYWVHGQKKNGVEYYQYAVGSCTVFGGSA